LTPNNPTWTTPTLRRPLCGRPVAASRSNRSTRGRAYGWQPVSIHGVHASACGSPDGRLGAQLANAAGSWNFSDLHTGDAAAATGFYAPLFGLGVRRYRIRDDDPAPGYGDHLAATVDPGIHERQEGISRPARLRRRHLLAAPLENGHDHWHVTFTVRITRRVGGDGRKAGAVVISSEDTEWTKTRADP